jgi:uncharacterized C2H2 Zn-finger protein
MSSSEVLRCDECGQIFDTLEELKEHTDEEKKELENRSKGFDDG